MASEPFATICCVSSRPVFWPWLAEQVRKQTYGRLNLVVVSPCAAALCKLSVVEPFKGLNFNSFGIVDNLLTVGEMRNIALQHASDEIVLWFDDDDWQHPQRVEWTVEAIWESHEEDPVMWASGHSAWFMDVSPEHGNGPLPACPFSHAVKDRAPIHSLAGFRTLAACGAPPYDSGLQASDSRWFESFRKHFRGARGVFMNQPLSVWLYHGDNLNRRKSAHWKHDHRDVIDAVGFGAWGDTDEHLAKLRSALWPTGSVRG